MFRSLYLLHDLGEPLSTSFGLTVVCASTSSVAVTLSSLVPHCSGIYLPICLPASGSSSWGVQALSIQILWCCLCLFCCQDSLITALYTAAGPVAINRRPYCAGPACLLSVAEVHWGQAITVRRG